MSVKTKVAPFADLLGKVSDTEIAKLAGCSTASVHYFRQRRGIPRAQKHSGWAEVCPGTMRMQVPMGWLYRVDGYGLCFVPGQARKVRS